MQNLNGDHWHLVTALFDILVDLDEDEREVVIKQRRPAASILRQVRELLDAEARQGVLDGSALALAESGEPSSYQSLDMGVCVGPFSIERLIGRGGMGEVYAARRIGGSFEQRVAIKLLRAEAAAHTGLFDRERRTLASLEHPGIARLIDGGLAPDGRPWMAMEYVDGSPIDRWCTEHRADVATRLRLMREVCEAVSYAHGRLVIHRDLKPSNVLVDESGRARLLDFGVARLLDESRTTGTPTQALVTPEYAAPEQLGNEASTVATDVYALGALLYHLLTGRGPWSGGGSATPSIVLRVLKDDPSLPSAATVNGDGPVAAGRLKGDLDAIVMKAMRRQPDDRYRSATDLGDELERHLTLRPVRARAGSTRYMAGRFVRRYRWAVGASAAAVLALTIGAGGIAWQARRTAVERDVVRAEARRSESINRMLTVMFRESATSRDGDRSTVKQMLDQTAARLVAELDTSARSATLIATLFDLYVNLEDAVGADALVSSARAKRIGATDPVARAQLDMRQASSAAALGRTAEMAPLLDASERVFARDPDRFRAELVEVASNRAQLFRRTGRLPEAIALLTATLPSADQVLADNHRDLLTIYNNLLVYMVEANQTEAMPAVFARADAILARTGQKASMQGLGIAQLKGVRLLKLARPVEAEPIFAGVVAQRREVFGRSAGLAVDLLQLGRAQLALKKYAAATASFTTARPMAAEKLGPSAPPTLIIGLGLAEAMAEGGNTAGADRILAEVTPLVLAMPKPGIATGLLAQVEAVTRLKQGRVAAARAALDRARQVFTELGPAGMSYLSGVAALRSRIDGAGQPVAISR